MLEHLLAECRIISPEDFHSKHRKNTLEKNEIVLTFDDGLKCQIDEALSVLEEKSIKAIFNVYTGILESNPPPLEIFAVFRETCFEDFDAFWLAFKTELDALYPSAIQKLSDEFPREYLSHFPFYSVAERKFRFMRDHILGKEAYQATMWTLISGSPISVSELARRLWMSQDDISSLAKSGHTIGLHSHTHPTDLASIDPALQRIEYQQNQDILAGVVDYRPTIVAHPCGSYSRETIEILQSLGVTLGFRSTMGWGGGGPLELPREDHANIFREMVRL